MRYRVTSFQASEDGAPRTRQKAGGGRVRVVLNETIILWLYAKEARQFDLAEGVELSQEQYQSLLHDVIGRRAIRRTLHLLERQPRTESQIRRKLADGGYPAEAIEEAVSYAKECHYLDDEQYVRSFIYAHQETRGRFRLQNDLIQKGIAKDIVERCLEGEYCSDEREQIRRILQKKGYVPSGADAAQTRRIYQFLMRRGFRHSDIMSQLKL